MHVGSQTFTWLLLNIYTLQILRTNFVFFHTRLTTSWINQSACSTCRSIWGVVMTVGVCASATLWSSATYKDSSLRRSTETFTYTYIGCWSIGRSTPLAPHWPVSLLSSLNVNHACRYQEKPGVRKSWRQHQRPWRQHQCPLCFGTDQRDISCRPSAVGSTHSDQVRLVLRLWTGRNGWLRTWQDNRKG